jgi:hypothetical protein
MTSLIYPAATHKRFEHSLGVMELAGRVFDVVTHSASLSDEVKRTIPEITQLHLLSYWRRVLRMAALCHDVGHLPFSHAAEKELLPTGWDHEKLTREIICSPLMSEIWNSITPPLRSEDVEKLAVGPRKATDLRFSTWETILSEIIVGDSFGVDRMDYLLRDSYHTGVPYGRFDHFRLIDTLRILPPASESDGVPSLGVEEGGLQSAEALLLGRYYMYSQVYFHPIRRIYDIHLKDFLAAWLDGGKFPIGVEQHLQLTDNEVYAALYQAARDSSRLGHNSAIRIAQHDHYKLLYQRHPDDVAVNSNSGEVIFKAASEKYGESNLRRDKYSQKGEVTRFPVQSKDGRIVQADQMSTVLKNLPLVSIDFIYIMPDLVNQASEWIKKERKTLIHPPQESS